MYYILPSRCFFLCIILLLQPISNFSHAETVISFHRKGYQLSLLLLALEKTIPSHGAYKVNTIKVKMNADRSKHELTLNTFPNLVFASAGDHQFFNQYAYAPFPIELGLFGYRVPMHHKDNTDKFSNITAIKQISNHHIIQGIGWFDTKVLTDNGFNLVNEGISKALEKMISTKRAELYFCSLADFKKERQEGVVINKQFGLFYSSPRFFIAHKSNKTITDRLYKGLVLAFNDGSLEKLMEKYFFRKHSKSYLFNRYFIELENNDIEGIDERYFEWHKTLANHFSLQK